MIRPVTTPGSTGQPTRTAAAAAAVSATAKATPRPTRIHPIRRTTRTGLRCIIHPSTTTTLAHLLTSGTTVPARTTASDATEVCGLSTRIARVPATPDPATALPGKNRRAQGLAQNATGGLPGIARAHAQTATGAG